MIPMFIENLHFIFQVNNTFIYISDFKKINNFQRNLEFK